MSYKPATLYRAVLNSMTRHPPYCKAPEIALDLGISVGIIAAVLESLQEQRKVEIHTTFNEKTLKSEYYWRLRSWL